jgi:hypothetical protein
MRIAAYHRPMASPRPRPTAATRLVDELLGGAAHPLAGELGGWFEDRGRFRAWAEANGPKIRKKVRGAGTDPGSLEDLRAELAVAWRLLADRRMDVAFEAYGSGRGGPDFTVTYRATTRFNVEVTRLRGEPDGDALASVVLGKLRQLPPSVANVLVLAVGRPVDGDAMATAVAALRSAADAREARILARAGVVSSRAFYDRFLRLGAAIAWSDAAPAPSAAAWPNPGARISVPPPALRALTQALESR